MNIIPASGAYAVVLVALDEVTWTQWVFFLSVSLSTGAKDKGTRMSRDCLDSNLALPFLILSGIQFVYL